MERGEEEKRPGELEIKELQLGNFNEKCSQKVFAFVKSLQFIS